MRIASNGLTLEVEEIGAPDGAPLILIMGLGAQLIYWDDAFCRLLADRGFRVIRFDHRDCGLSTYFDGVSVDPAPYRLTDLARDVTGLMDALAIPAAHVVGSSMGGMIAQTLASDHPSRVLSLVSLMSNTGEPDHGALNLSLTDSLTASPPPDRNGYIAYRMNVLRHLAADGYWDDEWVLDRETRAYDRAFYPEGAIRHTAAIRASGSRAAGLRTVTAPTLVVHGRNDPIIGVAGAVRTAELIPDARLLIFDHMGHALPEPQWEPTADAIADNAARASVNADIGDVHAP